MRTCINSFKQNNDHTRTMHNIQFRHTIANQSCWKRDSPKVYKDIQIFVHELTAANKKVIKVVDTQILTKISKKLIFYILTPLVSKFNLDFEFQTYFPLFYLFFYRKLCFERYSGILFEK